MSTSDDYQNEASDYVADYLPHAPLDYAVVKDPPIDSAIVNLDQEFSDAFEKRMSRIVDVPDLQFVQAGDDMYKTLKMFRRVAQLMGDEWRPVFKELMKKQSEEVIESQLKEIETHKPLIQGYRALMLWKEISGPYFHMSRLVDALNASDMADIALETLCLIKENNDNVKPAVSLKRNATRSRRRIDVSAIENDKISNKELLLVAKKLSKEWFKFGQFVSIEESELEDIKGYVGAEHEKLFKILWSWKEVNKASPDCKDKLKKAIQDFGRGDVISECFEA